LLIAVGVIQGQSTSLDKKKGLMRITAKQIPIIATLLVCVLLYGSAAIAFHDRGFFSAGVFVNFFTDNAMLGIASIGMTFVILGGGIDLSVGSVVGLTSIFIASAMDRYKLPPAVAILAALLGGTLFGGGMGAVIRYFGLPSFLVTLAGMFFARGAGFLLHLESVPIDNPFYNQLSEFHLPLGGGIELTASALIFLFTFVVALYIAQYTCFGRNVYALGGNEQSAILMGLPTGPVKMRVYALSGFCSALAGVVYTLGLSGNPSAAAGLELDAIAAVVIGGTLLTGGVGYMAGTLIGVLILGIIQTAITFQGSLSSWWAKIAIGLLLLIFILLQRFVQTRKLRT
jgi:ribose/xylose/arabinose/galactoside ABC-type transport system permease subunit